jgi:Phosphatidylserine decarboxylase
VWGMLGVCGGCCWTEGCWAVFLGPCHGTGGGGVGLHGRRIGNAGAVSHWEFKTHWTWHSRPDNGPCSLGFILADLSRFHCIAAQDIPLFLNVFKDDINLAEVGVACAGREACNACSLDATQCTNSFFLVRRTPPAQINDPLDSFKTFNEFFYRKLKPGARPIAAPEEDSVIVSCADCRLVVS